MASCLLASQLLAWSVLGGVQRDQVDCVSPKVSPPEWNDIKSSACQPVCSQTRGNRFHVLIGEAVIFYDCICPKTRRLW